MKEDIYGLLDVLWILFNSPLTGSYCISISWDIDLMAILEDLAFNLMIESFLNVSTTHSYPDAALQNHWIK